MVQIPPRDGRGGSEEEEQHISVDVTRKSERNWQATMHLGGRRDRNKERKKKRAKKQRREEEAVNKAK